MKKSLLKSRIKRLRIISTILLMGIIVYYNIIGGVVHFNLQLLTIKLDFFYGYGINIQELPISSIFLGYIVSFIGTLYTIKLLGKRAYLIFLLIMSALGILTYLNEITRLFYEHRQFIALSPPLLIVFLDWLSFRALKDIEDDKKSSWFKSIVWIFFSTIAIFIVMSLAMFVINTLKPKTTNPLVFTKSDAQSYYEQGNYPKAIESFSKIVEHLKEKERCAVYVKIADSYRLLEIYDKAIIFNQKALALTKSDEVTSIIYNNLALVYGSQNNMKKAEEFYYKSLEIQPDPSKKPAIYNNIAMLWSSKKEYDKAIDVMQKAVDSLELASPKKYEHIAQIYKNMGVMYLLKKDTKKGLELYQKALDTILPIRGNLHPVTLRIYSDIAKTEGEYLRHSITAIAIYKNNIEYATQMYGEEHPFVAESYYDLGRIYAFFSPVNDLPRAKIYFDKSLKIYRKFHKDTHPTIQIVLRDLNKINRKE